jgi:hypothetical protein
VTGGCGLLGKFAKKSVAIPTVLEPLDKAETPQLLAEINRVAAVRSIKGKVDLEFEDLAAAGAGIAEKYKRADGQVYVQRPGQIYLVIQAPLVGTKIVEMASDGAQFQVAVLQGDRRRIRFVTGRNQADYSKLRLDEVENAPNPKAMKGEKEKVGSFAKARPQHFTEGLLLNPIAATPQSNFIYVRSETAQQEKDTRPAAKKDAQVVRGYYLLDEVASNGDGTGRVARRFWFDRYQGLRLARAQIFGESGAITTDVTYSENKPVGADGKLLPTRLAIRRPQEKYGFIMTYQEPPEVTLDKEFDPAIFVLENKNGLPLLNLDDLLRGKS